MKLTTVAVLAFAATLALANSIPYEETAVYSRDFYERDGGEGSSESFDKRGGAIASLFKSFASAAGSMSGRVASNSAQYGISRGISPPKSSTHSKPKRPRTRHRQPHLRQLWRPPPSQPPSLEERTVRRVLSTPVAHLEFLEKRKKGKADRAPSLFKAASGAIGTMGGRVASSAAQLGLLKTMIPPPPPPPLTVARRALFPVAASRSSFAPVRAIKNVFSRTSQATGSVYRKSSPARKKGKVAFLDGITDGVTKKKT